MSAPDKKPQYGCAESIGLLLLVPVLTAAGALISAFVGVRVWAWFIVPTLHVMPLPFAAVVGIDLFYSAVIGHSHRADDGSMDDALARWFTLNVFIPAIILGLAWAFKAVIL